MDDGELWSSDDNEGEDRYDGDTAGPTFIKLDLTYVGESGEFHTRNRPGQKQRPVVTSRGGNKKSRFHIQCIAKCIIHGSSDEASMTPASLLVYDFEFVSSNSSARIKEAFINFEFQSRKHESATGPAILAIRPYGKNIMEETTQDENTTTNMELALGGNVAGLQLGSKIAPSKSIDKTTSFATVVTGTTPADDFGFMYTARWSLVENASQKSGVPSLLRAVILLERENDDEFICIPSITAKLDLKSQVVSLFSPEIRDDPVEFDPTSEPFNQLAFDIDRWNLNADLDRLWDITLHNKFEQSIKTSKPPKEQVKLDTTYTLDA